MSLAQDVSNQSIRQAIATVAEAVDKFSPVDTQAIGALTASVNDLKAAVKALDVAINGEPVPTPSADLPAPTSPVG